jgi:uncharacterized membrane protein YesL
VSDLARDIYRQNRFIEFLSRLFDILILNFLTLALCVPVITAADATASMYYVLLKIVRDEDNGVVKPYFRFFGDNFLKSLPYALILVPVNALLYFFLIGIAYGGWGNPVLFGLLLSVLAIVIVLSVWTLLLFAQFDNTVGKTFENALNLASHNPARSAIILIANGLMGVLAIFSPSIFIYMLAIWLFMGAGIIGFISVRQAEPVFRELMPEKEVIPDPLEEGYDDDEESGE